jgi:L-seryl-tRNA(Ser) seleniumtransferase
MAAVARRHDTLLIDDLGSGAAESVADEPTVGESLGLADVVTFSGDKLLGGPQAGLILARSAKGVEAMRKLSRHPLARAVRIDKLTLAALEATLRLRLAGHLEDIPVERMLRMPIEEIRRRAGLWSVKLEERGVATTLIPGESAAGGGSLPGHPLPTMLIALAGPASRLATALRRGEPPVIARIEKDACCLDARTVLRGEDEQLIDAVEAAVKSVLK